MNNKIKFKELEEFSFIRTNDDLTKYVAEHLKEGRANYLFVDEIQDIKGFEHTLRSLQAQDACDIFITGSEWTSGSNVNGIMHVHLGEFLQK